MYSLVCITIPRLIQGVVKANSQSNGKGQISTPVASKPLN